MTTYGVRNIASADEFSSLLSANKFVIADFYADWCGPCRTIAPTFAHLAASLPTEVAAKMAFAKIDVDKLPDIAQQYGVTAMPTFMFFRDGKVDANRPLIRGADVRSLQSGVDGIKIDVQEMLRAERERMEQIVEAEAHHPKGDTGTVSGPYEMTDAREDWKTTLRA